MSRWYMLDEDMNVIPAPEDERGMTTHEYQIWLYGDGASNLGHRAIKQETVKGHWVSTVFLGLDHSHTKDGPPVVFETMIFPGKDNLLERECWRYSTYQEALEGHANACKVALSYCSGIDPDELKKGASVIQSLLDKE